MKNDHQLLNFKATIYRIGINLVVDVPAKVTNKLKATKGLIKVQGTINSFPFHTTLMPVKDKPYILYVNTPMLKGTGAVEGDAVKFSLEQDLNHYEHHYPMPAILARKLKDEKLLDQFEQLTESRKKDILKYLSYVKTEETLLKHITILLQRLRAGEKNIRIP
ncbi:DUF1905 domain-containing protein [Flavitalea sp.]|nr:DUF1905 domain-containing protein [Flavitalea sp.]